MRARQKPHRGKQVTLAEFRRMWFDPSMTVADIARALDICPRSVWQRARHRGLPHRSQVVSFNPEAKIDGEGEAMYRAGVCAKEIAARYGVKLNTVHMHMWRNGIRREAKPSRWRKALTIADFRALQLREAMAASARETEAALRLAEMKDGDPRKWAA